MRKMRKKLVALVLGACLGVGVLTPMGDMGNVKAEELSTEDWNVTAIPQEEDGSSEAEAVIGDALEKNEEDTEGVAEDSMEVQAAPGCTTVSGTIYYSKAYEVLNIVNQRRAENGQSALAMDKSLLESAMLRAAEISVDFSHTRPNGEDCFSVDELAFGENIAYGFNSATDVMAAWMGSEGHRKNILGSGYESIGIGCFYKDGVYYWAQLFGIETPASFPQPSDRNASYDVVMDAQSFAQGYTLQAKEIYVKESDPRYGFEVYMETNAPAGANIEYSWYVSTDNGASWSLICDWDEDAYGIAAVPRKFGEYLIVAKARKAGDDSTTVSSSFAYSYHPVIKGICQMPYTGAGGGYLIGIESYDNPNQSYHYEMLILDCTLYAQGKDAWIYTTGKCLAPENCLWTVWQPQYGYYWTLFRVYDSQGTLIDERCYGFVNAY